MSGTVDVPLPRQLTRVFDVPRAIDVEDSAAVVVSLATAQLGLWHARRRAEERARTVEHVQASPFFTKPLPTDDEAPNA